MLPNLTVLTNPRSNGYGHPPRNTTIHKQRHKLKPPTQKVTATTGVHKRTQYQEANKQKHGGIPQTPMGSSPVLSHAENFCEIR